MKKFVAFVLSVFMTFGGANFIFAENNIPEVLEQTILSVKDRLNIPEEYSEFEYIINNYNGKEKYNMVWSKPGTLVGADTKEEDYGNDEIRVNVDTEGNIFSYTNWRDNYEKSTIADKKSKEECLKAAQNFIQMVIPENYSEFRLEKNLSSGNQFVFRQYKGDIPVRFNTINVSVDSVELRVERYYYENADYLKKDFPSAEGVMDLEKAVTEFSSKIPVEPEYIFNYDYKTKEKKVFIAYRPKSSFYNKALDAKTGDLIECNTFNGENYRSANTMEMDDASTKESGGGLSVQERAKIEEAKGLISKEEADNEIKKLLPVGASLNDMQSADLMKDEIDGNYIWNLSYENGDAAYDATNKQLKRFYIYDMAQETSEEADIIPGDYDSILASRKSQAEEYIKTVASDKFDSVEFAEKDSDIYELSFVRKVNGLSFPENCLRVVFDKDGKISNYYSEWYNSIEFPKADGLISSADIVNKSRDLFGFGLVYELGRKIGSPYDEFKIQKSRNKSDLKNDIILSYSFIDMDSHAPFISANTGKEINYDGTDFKGFNVPESYPDIAGHWCEKYVNALLNNDIYIKNADGEINFLPDNEITKNQLFEFYGNFYNNDIKKALKDKEEPITKKELCGIVRDFLGFVKIADKDIFKNPFSDVTDDNPDLGSMVISNALDMLTADENGNFNPDKYVTNAEAAKVLYMLEELR